MLKVAVIGTGSMGSLHLRILSEIHEAKIAAIVDKDPIQLKKMSEKYGVKGYTDHNEMLDKEKPGFVIVAVPSDAHKKVALDVISRGIPLMVEKPLAMNSKDAKEMIAAAKQRGVKMMVGHIERFNPVIEALKNTIDPKNIISISITRVSPFPPRVGNIGVIRDVGVHDIDLLRYLTESEFDTINALSSSNIADKEDTAIMSFKMKSGALASINSNWLTPFRVRSIEISTKEKFVKADLITQQVSEYSSFKMEGQEYKYLVGNVRVPFGESAVRELRHFIDCVTKDVKPIVTAEDGLKAIETAEKCLNYEE